MFRVDADTHLDETEATWEHMTEAERRYKPLPLDPPEGKSVIEGDPRPHRLWCIDGRLKLRRTRDDARSGTVAGTRELSDVPLRLQHMDDMGVDIQVMYPTLLLAQVTDRPESEVALCRSYNRWVAEATAKAGGRLRWVVVPPVLSMDHALQELRFGKEHGACGVLKRAVECGGRADRKSTRLNSSHIQKSRMPSSA